MPSAPAEVGTWTVTRISDGDTLHIRAEDRRTLPGGEDVKVRLLEIDTPETTDPNRPDECFGEEATAALSRLLPVGTEIKFVAATKSLGSL